MTDNRFLAYKDANCIDAALQTIHLIGVVFDLDASHQLAFGRIDFNQCHACTLDGHLVSGRVGEDVDFALVFIKSDEIVGASGLRLVGNTLLEDWPYRCPCN